ncbi:MAG TPA: type II toxin-antitoxin system HicA family toxin [Gemmataceae bacterium]|nr:type II toxin-antitoxin system HicA family toxin [Gemmataceae bacterium]
MKTVSGKDFCKALERNGWVLKRISKSSHHIYVKPGHPPLSVPVHGNKDLKKGLQHHLMEVAGLTAEDL